MIYATNNELSEDKTIQKKQFQMLELLWKYYIKECDYSYIVKVLHTDKYNIVFTFDWPDKMDLTNLNRLLCEFVYRTETYLQIHKTLHDELNKTYRPTLSQQKFVNNFTKYYEDWFTYDADYFLTMYKSKYLLDEFIAMKDTERLVY